MRLKVVDKYKERVRSKQKLVDSQLKFLSSYLIDQGYDKKTIDKIVEKNFIQSNPKYYMIYPFFFNEYFKVDNFKILQTISLSGFLYYKSLIFIDNIFDKSSGILSFDDYMIANICQEESIKLLTSVFEWDSIFWKYWNMRKKEYALAFEMERNPKNVDYNWFKKLADFKSAFGKIAIDSLHLISENENDNLYEDLIESHKCFYTAFQIMDDIGDIEEDFENNQFNIANFKINEYLSKIEVKDNLELNIVDKKKLMYSEGVAEKLYEEAINCIEQGLEIVLPYTQKSDLWILEQSSLHNTAISHYLNIQGFLKKNSSERHRIIERKEINNVESAINSGYQYLSSIQNEDGSWNDILNDAGISNVWTTSFISYLLAECSDQYPPFLKQSIKFVEDFQGENILCGYNDMWIPDADSTSFALLCLKNKHEFSSHPKSFELWWEYQNKDFGFSTYREDSALLSSLNSNLITSVKGWTQSHACVSSIAFLVCAEYGINNQKYKNLRKYILNILDNDPLVSYWWTKSIYTLFFILKAAVKNKDVKIIELCESLIIRCEYDNYNYFYKGLFLGSLCLTDNLYRSSTDKINILFEDICGHQFFDGSWEESDSLRIPFPTVINPNSEVDNWINSDQGTNIITEDFNRTFTTISCVTGLRLYEKKCSQFNT